MQGSHAGRARRPGAIPRNLCSGRVRGQPASRQRPVRARAQAVRAGVSRGVRTRRRPPPRRVSPGCRLTGRGEPRAPTRRRARKPSRNRKGRCTSCCTSYRTATPPSRVGSKRIERTARATAPVNAGSLERSAFNKAGTTVPFAATTRRRARASGSGTAPGRRCGCRRRSAALPRPWDRRWLTVRHGRARRILSRFTVARSSYMRMREARALPNGACRRAVVHAHESGRDESRRERDGRSLRRHLFPVPLHPRTGTELRIGVVDASRVDGRPARVALAATRMEG